MSILAAARSLGMSVARVNSFDRCTGGTFLAFASGLAFVQPTMAAHAGAPYTNVDSRSDRGNDIGDSQIEGLNQSQLDQNYGMTLSGPAGAPR